MTTKLKLKKKKGKKLALHIRIRRAIAKKGIKKAYLCGKLFMSRPTLNTYLKAGGFTPAHTAILKKERVI